MRRIVIFYLFFTQIVALLFTQNIAVDEYNRQKNHYFENKNNDIISDTIEIFRNEIDNINNPDRFISNLTFFFYGIKKDNMERYEYFYNIVRQSGIQRLISIFETIERTDFDNYLLNPTINPSLNDIYWTLYFSSGNEIYLKNIIEIIEIYKESNNMLLYLTARSGIWSFRLNIGTYPAVLAFFLSYASNDLKVYLLGNTPDEITNETIEFLRKQRESGIW
jgi:hypothetical protein